MKPFSLGLDCKELGNESDILKTIILLLSKFWINIHTTQQAHGCKSNNMYYCECEHYLVYLGCDFKKKIDVENIQTSILKINERKKQGYAIPPSPSP